MANTKSNFLRKSLVAFAALLAVGIGFSPQPADAGASSAYLIGKIYGNVLQGAAYTPPATVYVALGTGTFTAQACTGEVSTTGTGYARVAVTANTTNFVASGVASNGTAITFGVPSASWGLVDQYCLFDAATGGNLLISAALTTSVTITTGQSAPSFSVGAMTWTVN